jgi:hypothetical protein
MALACDVLVAEADAKTRARTAALAATTTPIFLLRITSSLQDERDSPASTGRV